MVKELADYPAVRASREQKPLEVVTILPPAQAERVRREAHFAAPGERANRYTLPAFLDSPSPVGYRTRVPLNRDEAEHALKLLAMPRPTGFAPRNPVREAELFEESALGILVSRQSTNFRGHKQVTLGPKDAERLAELMRELQGLNAPVLAGAAYAHVVLARPYRTPFTMLLTLVGHPLGLSLPSWLTRLVKKRFFHADDIPTIGYLTHLHVGVLADNLERAVVLASAGRRRAQVHVAPFAGTRLQQQNRAVLARIEQLAGLSRRDYLAGYRVAIVAQVGEALPEERVELPTPLYRKLGAALMALRSERIQPGVNQEEKAPAAYQSRQHMDVPDELTVMAGRTAYNAFAHHTGVERERAKELLLLDRVDVLTAGGKERLRAIRSELDAITTKMVKRLPLWAELPTARAFSKNAARGRKAFALAGQRIYITGLSRRALKSASLGWELAVRAAGAAAARSALYVELMGMVELPGDCDLLAGICLMAGPVNQNDIGKQFYGYPDLLAGTYAEQDPTSLLVWTLKAKTVADPIGNEEQLLSVARKGALVDLRPGPHEVVALRVGGRLVAMRQRQGRINGERAFAEAGNFVADPDGREIPGNRGNAWPRAWREEVVWSEA
jgi:hypothetical protein